MQLLAHMMSLTIIQDASYTHIIHALIEKRSFRSFIIKPFLHEIKMHQNPESFASFLLEVEKKAARKYFLFLLSKKDYLSSELLKKAELAGLSKTISHELIQEFKNKHWIDDARLKEKLALKKLKKGYSIKASGGLSSCHETETLEKEALHKLIQKKRKLFLSDDFKDKQKGYRFLLSRGFSIEQINSAINLMEE